MTGAVEGHASARKRGQRTHASRGGAPRSAAGVRRKPGPERRSPSACPAEGPCSTGLPVVDKLRTPIGLDPEAVEALSL
jgi:hypothetical protein